MVVNFDQSPYYKNECAAQDKVTLAVRGENVPIVESKGAAHNRWTVVVSVCSDPATIEVRHPGCEAMFKAAEGCLLYTSPSPRDATLSRMPSSA